MLLMACLSVVIVLLLRCQPYSEIHVGEQEEFGPFSLDDPSCSVAASKEAQVQVQSSKVVFICGGGCSTSFLGQLGEASFEGGFGSECFLDFGLCAEASSCV